MEIEVLTEVLPENGQWRVWLVILTPEGVERRPLQTYFTQAKALLAADVIARTANRRRPPRPGP